jgi:hypothetical protein
MYVFRFLKFRTDVVLAYIVPASEEWRYRQWQ